MFFGWRINKTQDDIISSGSAVLWCCFDDEVLLQRLRQLKEKRVILVGDFNAAFKEQTDLINSENHEFLSCILKEKYIELKDEDERKGIPHYTYARFNKNKNICLKKKLDHVFISDSLNIDQSLSVEIEYLDEVNINCSEISKNSKSKEISDHMGIKIHISKKNP